ncbi:hypothetical protein [Halalkalibacter akibai]|uniref:Uncharacterized protein n=1 Tax=Halalkalibacter akibai (strain ATCC 43226 / DSM 21942 / CIP 109018 / JCM 9157 / 1139) TaxID=1236973 RepID=W4R283_HALA3|nr:hypothetical protein [Halalkalibacter akibai]GAE37664.1 hypothetical protein JCM9157_4981 [Halalkalibacter akibai JCM 9157]
MKVRKSVPVSVYKNNELLEEFPSIKEAAHFMKVELGREFIPWSIINKGIHEKKSYTHINGTIYRFEQLSEKVKKKQPVDIHISSKNKLSRIEFIEFISEHLEQSIHLKLQISDQRLRKYHLSPKGLGDDLYFLTESYHRQNNLYHGKYSMTDFITKKALYVLQQKEKTKLIFEHMVPKNLYLSKLVTKAQQGVLTHAEIYRVMMKYYYTCTVTKEEDYLLPSTKMQDDWDEQNPFYRYQVAGIDFIENPKSFK